MAVKAGYRSTSYVTYMFNFYVTSYMYVVRLMMKEHLLRKLCTLLSVFLIKLSTKLHLCILLLHTIKVELHPS